MKLYDFIKLNRFIKCKIYNETNLIYKELDEFIIFNNENSWSKIKDGISILVESEEEFFKENILNRIKEFYIKLVILKKSVDIKKIKKLSNIHKNITFVILNDNYNMNEVLEEIENFKFNFYLEVSNEKVKLNKTFMRMIMVDADTKTLIEFLKEYIQRDIILLDNYYNTIYLTNKNFKICKEYSENHTKEINISIYKNNKKLKISEYIINKIFSKELIFGYVIVLNSDSLTSFQTIIVDQFSIMLAVFFYKNNLSYEKIKKLQQDCLINLLENKKNLYEIKETLDKIDFIMFFPQRIIYIKTLKIEDNKKYIDLFEKEFYPNSNLARIIEYDNNLVLFTTEDYVDKILKIFKNVKKIGISNRLISIDEYSKGYIQAKTSIELSKILQISDNKLCRFDDYSILDFISKINNIKYLQQIVDETFGDLLKNSEDSELLDTLLILIKNKFNKANAAKELYIHYNTLRYRMEKLEKLGMLEENGLKTINIIFAYYVYCWLKNKNR